MYGTTISEVAFAWNGSLVAAGDWGGAVKVWDADTGREVNHFAALAPAPVNTLAFSTR